MSRTKRNWPTWKWWTYKDTPWRNKHTFRRPPAWYRRVLNRRARRRVKADPDAAWGKKDGGRFW